jgi:hypothetical protein
VQAAQLSFNFLRTCQVLVKALLLAVAIVAVFLIISFLPGRIRPAGSTTFVATPLAGIAVPAGVLFRDFSAIGDIDHPLISR